MATNLHDYQPSGHLALCQVCGFSRSHPWHDEPCEHQSAVGFSAEDGTSTLTCSSCGEVLVLDTGEDKYEIEINGVVYPANLLTFRSWTGRRWLNGEEYTGPTYLWLSTREYQPA